MHHVCSPLEWTITVYMNAHMYLYTKTWIYIVAINTHISINQCYIQ